MMVDVSRETPPPPQVADRIFGATLPTAMAYADILATTGVDRGLLGPQEVSRIWDRHLVNCAVVAPMIARNSSVCDIGSGAGLPGMVLALMRPDLGMVLVEPLLRRSAFLTQSVKALGLENVTIMRSRAEDLAGSLHVDVVTARAVAPLARLLGWALALCAPNGQVLAIKGESVDSEIAGAMSTLSGERVAGWDVVEVGAAGLAHSTTVVRVRCGAGHVGGTESPDI